MPQTIEINTPIQILIPSHLKVVEIEEYESLKKKDLMGKTWTMENLKDQLKTTDEDWIKEKILYPNRDILDVRNGGFVRYSKGKGNPWKFNALEMAKYLQENWADIMSD